MRLRLLFIAWALALLVSANSTSTDDASEGDVSEREESAVSESDASEGKLEVIIFRICNLVQNWASNSQ